MTTGSPAKQGEFPEVRLDRMESILERIEKNMASKDDLKKMSTKDDLASLRRHLDGRIDQVEESLHAAREASPYADDIIGEDAA